MFTVHSSHKTRFSDSSLYDTICINCGYTDAGAAEGLAAPCQLARASVERDKLRTDLAIITDERNQALATLAVVTQERNHLLTGSGVGTDKAQQLIGRADDVVTVPVRTSHDGVTAFKTCALCHGEYAPDSDTTNLYCRRCLGRNIDDCSRKAVALRDETQQVRAALAETAAERNELRAQLVAQEALASEIDQRLYAEVEHERAERNRIARECADKIDRQVDYGRLRHAEDEVEAAENVLRIDAGILMGTGATVADGIREVIERNARLHAALRTQAISTMRHFGVCRLCKKDMWVNGTTEIHAPDCLAAPRQEQEA